MHSVVVEIEWVPSRMLFYLEKCSVYHIMIEIMNRLMAGFPLAGIGKDNMLKSDKCKSLWL